MRSYRDDQRFRSAVSLVVEEKDPTDYIPIVNQKMEKHREFQVTDKLITLEQNDIEKPFAVLNSFYYLQYANDSKFLDLEDYIEELIESENRFTDISRKIDDLDYPLYVVIEDPEDKNDDDLNIEILHDFIKYRDSKGFKVYKFGRDSMKLRHFDQNEVKHILEKFAEFSLSDVEFDDKFHGFDSKDFREINLGIPNKEDIIRSATQRSIDYHMFGDTILRITKNNLINFMEDNAERNNISIDKSVDYWKNENAKMMGIPKSTVKEHFSSWEEFEKQCKKREVVEKL